MDGHRLAAAATTNNADITTILLNLGLPGVLLLVGAMVIRYLYQQREAAWTGERSNLLDAIGRADARAQEAEKVRDRAIDGLKSFMEVAQTDAMSALRESQSALTDAVTRERVLTDRIGNLERELDLSRRQR